MPVPAQNCSIPPLTKPILKEGVSRLGWGLVKQQASRPLPLTEQHATIEHSRVSLATPWAGPATVARMCGPAGPSRGLGPAWADNESSWAVLPEVVPEDEPDVLY